MPSRGKKIIRLGKKSEFLIFSPESFKNKGKIVVEARNMQNVRLRRTKSDVVFENLDQNQLNLVKIAPEGCEFFGTKKYHFTKTNKETLPLVDTAYREFTLPTGSSSFSDSGYLFRFQIVGGG